MVIMKQTSWQWNVFEHLLALVYFAGWISPQGTNITKSSTSVTETRIPVMFQSVVIVIATQVSLFHCHCDENTLVIVSSSQEWKHHLLLLLLLMCEFHSRPSCCAPQMATASMFMCMQGCKIMSKLQLKIAQWCKLKSPSVQITILCYGIFEHLW